MHVVQKKLSPIFSSNFEANASELLENIGKMCGSRRSNFDREKHPAHEKLRKIYSLNQPEFT